MVSESINNEFFHDIFIAACNIHLYIYSTKIYSWKVLPGTISNDAHAQSNAHRD